jgi:hypothetical protein
MSALIDSLQMLPGGPLRWFLREVQPGQFEWTRAIVEGTRFDDERASGIQEDHKKHGSLPMLPTEPPLLPSFVRVVHGDDAPPVIPVCRPPAPVARPEPESGHRSLNQVQAQSRRILSGADAIAHWQEEHEA